jgi:hypothetical protein
MMRIQRNSPKIVQQVGGISFDPRDPNIIIGQTYGNTGGYETPMDKDDAAITPATGKKHTVLGILVRGDGTGTADFVIGKADSAATNAAPTNPDPHADQTNSGPYVLNNLPDTATEWVDVHMSYANGEYAYLLGFNENFSATWVILVEDA